MSRRDSAESNRKRRDEKKKRERSSDNEGRCGREQVGVECVQSNAVVYGRNVWMEKERDVE